MIWTGFDIETEGDQEGYALQPWRVREGTARITISAAYHKGKRKVVVDDHGAFLEELRDLDSVVVGHNMIFDLAFLYASGINISGVRWMDTLLLWKFLDNGQSGPMTWTLKAAAKKFLKDWDKQEEFLSLKEEDLPDPSDPYWITRVTHDAEATALIAEIIWSQLTSQQQNLAKIQSLSLPVMAASWVNGVHVDQDAIRKARPVIVKELLELEDELKLREPMSAPDNYIPSKVLRSSVKKRKLFYEDYGLPCTRFTEKGNKSTDKAAMTYLSDIDDRMQTVMKWSELNTILSKFIDGPIKCCEYLGSSVTHAAPRMFSTYTGRMTYSSKSKKNRIGVPLHQTPRKKEIRSYVVAPEGYYIFEADAMGQEMRGMATMSKDPAMVELFNSPHPYDDGHSLMGSRIGKMSFDEFLQKKKNNEAEVTGPQGLRAAGKFCNLSMAYRSGPATSRRVARVQYGLDVTVNDVVSWKSAYTDLFKGVPKYWDSAPKIARTKGYAETPAGRRYGLTRWRDLQWGTSSSAINFPIQGMGADQRDLAIATVVLKHPELWDKFYLDLHDGAYFIVPKTARLSYLQGVMHTLDHIDYQRYWGVELPVPYLWEGSFGPDWGHKIDIPMEQDEDPTLEEVYNARP